MKKIRVGILFGGQSTEHEVSLQSAKNVIEAIDREKFEPVLIGIDKTGRWYLNQESEFLLNATNPKLIKLNKATAEKIALQPGDHNEMVVHTEAVNKNIKNLDVVFPILHGPLGEDGTVQGLMRLMDVAFVGPGVLGSAIGMDKDVTKRLALTAGVEVAPFATFHMYEITPDLVKEVGQKLGYPLFVKPANMGSSVGISRASNEKELQQAVGLAVKFDRKIIIEKGIKGREIEVAVLGNEDPKASVPGEIIPQDGFYSYEAKYVDEKGAKLEAPADLPAEKVKEVQKLAVEIFKVLECEGMARVDFFLQEDGTFIFNEINTIPGFTNISMYPRLWGLSGVSYKELITKLIDLALDRQKQIKNLKTDYDF
jgi:D-alanine-D-alanine ligase